MTRRVDLTPRPRRAGVSLPETLISLSVSALLLTGIAAAYTASSNAIRINDNYFRSTHAARVALVQMLGALRTCESVQVGATANPAANVVTASSIYFYDANSQLRLYRLRSGVLEYVPSGTDAGTAHPVAGNVASLTFTGELQADSLGVRRVVRVAIDLRLDDGAQPMQISGAAVPRRAMAP